MSTNSPPASRRPPRSRKSARRQRSHWSTSVKLLLVVGVFLLVYYSLRPLYYSWLLGPEIKIVLYCDTAELSEDNARASVLYDKLALSPIPQLWGLYQNRPAEEVQSFHAVKHKDIKITEAAVVIPGVQDGPIRQINIYSNGEWHKAPVEDANRKDGTLYIFLE